MRKFKNKFIVIITVFVIAILWFEIYKTLLVSDTRDSYVVLVSGKATLNDENLLIDQKELLKKDDRVNTIWDESLALIKWWDWSVTRMWWNSEIIVKEAQIEKNLLNINISFELTEGKTWSDVINFIWEESYFHQSFADTTAAVRGTIFEVNLENDYVYLDKHEVKLTKENWEVQILNENTKSKALRISDFSFIDFAKFIRLIKDKAWQSLNIKLDKEFYNKIKKWLEELKRIEIKTIENIEELSEQKKKELYNELLLEYQKFNFIDTKDIELYRKKLEIKKELIKVSSEENKQNLIRTSFYDLDDLLKNENFEELSETFKIFASNPNSLKGIDVKLTDYIDVDIFKTIDLPEWLKTEFSNSFDNIKNILNIDLNNNSIIDSAKESLDNVKDTFSDLKDLIK